MKEAAIAFTTVTERALQGNAAAGSGTTALTWQETLAVLEQEEHIDLRAMSANARHAQRYGSPTPLQLALVLFREDIAQHYRELRIITSMCVLIADIVPRYPENFAASLPQLVGWEYDSAGYAFRPVTLQEYYTRLYMDKAAVFIGANGDGKTNLCLSLGKDFAIRKRLPHIVGASLGVADWRIGALRLQKRQIAHIQQQ